MRATFQDTDMARLTGVDVDKVYMFTFAFGAAPLAVVVHGIVRSSGYPNVDHDHAVAAPRIGRDHPTRSDLGVIRQVALGLEQQVERLLRATGLEQESREIALDPREVRVDRERLLQDADCGLDLARERVEPPQLDAGLGAPRVERSSTLEAFARAAHVPALRQEPRRYDERHDRLRIGLEHALERLSGLLVPSLEHEAPGLRQEWLRTDALAREDLLAHGIVERGQAVG